MCTFVLITLIGTAFAASDLSFILRDNSRIVGGNLTTIDKYPYMSNMMYYYDSSWWQTCGGSLLTPNTVLSATHCYIFIGDPLPASSWRVRLGSSYRSSGGDVHEVSRITLHQGYSPSSNENDIALVHLAVPANTESPNIALARIPGPDYIIPDNTVVTALGWGRLEWGSGSQPSEQLRHVNLFTINQELCYQRYRELTIFADITDGMLCAGILDVGGKDTCQGDSGGPLAHLGDIIVGITSWGYSCGHHYWPGVSTRVSYFTDWIRDNAF